MDWEIAGMLFIGLLMLGAYFLPTMVAGNRDHHNFGAIFATNLLLGWTGIGWIIAFIWALTATPGGDSRTDPPPRE